MSVSELGPYHARSGIDRFLHPRRYGGPNYAAFDVANHFWEWCGGLDDSATPRFERYPSEATRRAWIEALLRARAAATSGDGCGSGVVVEPAAVDRFCRAVKQISTRQSGDAEGAEFVYQIGLRDRGRSNELLARLREVEGVTHASLVLRNELSEV